MPRVHVERIDPTTLEWSALRGPRLTGGGGGLNARRAADANAKVRVHQQAKTWNHLPCRAVARLRRVSVVEGRAFGVWASRRNGPPWDEGVRVSPARSNSQKGVIEIMPAKRTEPKTKTPAARKATIRRKRAPKIAHDDIAVRAYYLHLEGTADPFENWVRAERELVGA